MLQVGDKVVYPMHGAGEITGTEECEIMDQVKQYYVLQLPVGNIKIMIPTDNADNIGLRQISTPEVIEQVKAALLDPPDKLVGSWNKRFHMNLDRLKTGDILEVASVIRNLLLQDRQRKISSGERRLLDLAKQIFISELSYALDTTTDGAETWVKTQLEANSF